jgi:hypothetical protein
VNLLLKNKFEISLKIEEFACTEKLNFSGTDIMKFTQATLDKVEKIAEESGYVIRYERGSFQSGYCILQERRVVVLNKFLQTEGRINTMIDLLPQLDINFDALTLESQKLFTEIIKFQDTVLAVKE